MNREMSSTPRPLRVLAAEDNPINQRLVLALLRQQGYSVAVAANGSEAVAAWEREPFDVILMDLHMPEMDGLAAAAEIRAREKAAGSRTPIIALTASSPDEEKKRCREAGMDGYLAKPIRAEELAELIESLVLRRQAPAPRLDPRGQPESAAAHPRRLNGLFVADAARLAGEIRDAIARQDGGALQAAAHRLRGSAGYFAAQRACELSARLEQLGKAGDFSTATERACEELDEELARLDRAVAAEEQ